ncbi:MAG: hypothetical protein JJ855_09945 [Rhodospirillales bacterium]|nr:hypothetical protein [Rhodospirillales bacterium]
MKYGSFIARTMRGLIGMLVGLCLTFVAVTGSCAEGAGDQCQSNSIDKSTDRGIKSAYNDFTVPKLRAAQKGIVEDLRFWLLSATSPEISCIREEIVRRGYLPGFVEMFDEVADWVKRIDDMTGEELYNLSQEIDNDPERTRTGKLISGNLMRAASEKKYPPALRAVADRYFNEKDNRFANCWGARALTELAKLGDREAALELARLYMSGARVEASDASALFWFGYAMILAKESEVDDEGQPLIDRMTDKEKHRVRLMLLSDTFPICRNKDE